MTDERHKDPPSLADVQKLHHQMPGWVVVLLVVGVAAILASYVLHLLMMLIISAVIAYILSSAISGLERLGIRRSVAVILLFGGGLVLVILADIIFIPDLKREIGNAYARFPEFSTRFEGALLSSSRNSPVFESGVRNLVDGVFGPNGFLEKTLSISEILTQATPFVMGLILVPFFVFFLLKDWPVILKRIMDWVPPSYVETTISVISEINILVGKYLRGLAADCFFVGVMASVGLWLIGINYPITLGILSGVANIVPYLGPITGCLLAGVIAVAQFNSLEPMLNVVLLYVSIRLTDDLLIQPLIIGKSVKLHPMLLVITIILGERLFGISGMILGVPAVTVAQKTVGILLEHRRETRRRESTERIVLPRIDKIPVRPL